MHINYDRYIAMMMMMIITALTLKRINMMISRGINMITLKQNFRQMMRIDDNDLF